MKDYKVTIRGGNRGELFPYQSSATLKVGDYIKLEGTGEWHYVLKAFEGFRDMRATVSLGGDSHEAALHEARRYKLPKEG